jgi:hypothetical protein
MSAEFNQIRATYAALSTPELRNMIARATTLRPECLLPLRHEAHRRKLMDAVTMLTGLLAQARAQNPATFFEQVDAIDVQQTVALLKQRLPQKATHKNLQLTRKLLAAQTFDGSNLQAALQAVADRMCAHLMLQRPIKILTLGAVDAGKYQLIEGLSCILINDDLDHQNYDQKLAILAHEMAHYYLIHAHKIHYPVEQENEWLTEIAAVYLGFGLLLLRGYVGQQHEVAGQLKTTSVGYVSTDLVYEAIIETAYVRKQKPQWLVRNLPFVTAIVAIPRLWRLYLDYRNSKKA